jgi:class 3 adenylate cyclase
MTASHLQDATDVNDLLEQLDQFQSLQQELDRRIFNLKTLYDVSKDIFSSTDSEIILRNFLLMVMGNFGVAEGLVTLFRADVWEVEKVAVVGIQESALVELQNDMRHMLRDDHLGRATMRPRVNLSPPSDKLLDITFPFTVDRHIKGALGLGPKLIDEQYNDNDQELLRTLVNNLSIALQNARSIEEIKTLNRSLEAKNLELENAMSELKAALRKVEILESIKSNLCKFVPTAVTRLMESSPQGEIQEARERDISVLFLDIEGYTRITEELGATEVNSLTEKYFSVFMDAIYQNNGDVVETAGDGLMVLFMTEDPGRHAMEAIQTAATIRAKTHGINNAGNPTENPVIINIGVSSGRAFVGASKFESYTGGRWAYTSHGTTTNIAARLCGQAKGGAILVSRETAMRTHHSFAYEGLGPFKLKNLSEEIEVFALTK